MIKYTLGLALLVLGSSFSLSDVVAELLHHEKPLPTKVDYVNDFKTPDCTTQLAAECALDIEKTVVACSAAFESGGANIIADIKCAKDLLADKKTCWPCICYEA
jgi:hypothetical protein